MTKRSCISAPSPSKTVHSTNSQTVQPKPSAQRQSVNTTHSLPLSPTSSLSQEPQTPAYAFQRQTVSQTNELSSPRSWKPVRDVALGTKVTSKPHRHRVRLCPKHQDADTTGNIRNTAKSQDTSRGTYTSTLAASSKSMISSSPKYRLAGDKSTSPSATRNQTWMENAQKMASSLSLSASTSERESSPQFVTRQRQEYSYPRPKNLARPTVAEMNLTIGPVVSRSKISSLRQRFDLPKSSTMPSLSFTSKKRRETTPIKATTYDSIPRLHKSATTTDLDNMSPSKQKPRGCDVGKRGSHGSKKSESILRGWSSGKSGSPLKDKIGLFESLDRKNGLSTPKGDFGKPRAVLSGLGHARGMKGTLRRLSASWKKCSSEWSTTSPQDPFISNHSGLDGESSTARDDERGVAPESPSSRSVRTSLHQDCASVNKYMTPRGSLVRLEFNIDGEGGLHPSSTMSPSAPSLPCSGSRHRISPLALTGRQRSIIDSTTTAKEQDGPRYRVRRIISRSSGPFVSRSYCTLEQPKPVRANELRRLVSLCKEKVARRISSGYGE